MAKHTGTTGNTSGASQQGEEGRPPLGAAGFDNSASGERSTAGSFLKTIGQIFANRKIRDQRLSKHV